MGPSRRWNPRKEPAEIQHPRVLGNPASRVGITHTIFAKNLLVAHFRIASHVHFDWWPPVLSGREEGRNQGWRELDILPQPDELRVGHGDTG